VKTFAIVVTLLMVLTVADSSIVKTATAEPVVSPAAGSNNDTPPPPPPPVPPPDEPQRPVEPGTATQSWDNSSFAPTPVEYHLDVAMQASGNNASYAATYGTFLFNKSSPYFVRFLTPGPGPREIAESAFLVLHAGIDLLSPGTGTVDTATSEEFAVHYGLYLSGSLMGTMTVHYWFQRVENKVTVSFSPSDGLPDLYQIVWLTFTTFDAIDTIYPADVEQRFEDLDATFGSLFLGLDLGTLYSTGRPDLHGAVIRPYKIPGSPGGPAIRMDASDAANDFEATYARSNFSFGGHSGNAALSTFLPGHLVIDPRLLLDGQPQDAVSHSGVTRKTFYDGDRYWFFSKIPDGKSIKYGSSIDGRTWVSGTQYVVTTSGSLSNGFTVVNYGKMVGVLWIDSMSPKAIQLRTGLIGVDQIQWDDAGHQLYSGANDITRPVSATFTSSGKIFVTTWGDSAGGVGTSTYKCTGPGSAGFSECATQVPVGGVDYGGSGPSYSLVAPFNGVDAVARIWIHSYTDVCFPGPCAQHSVFSVRVFSGAGPNCPDTQFADTGQDLGDAWIADGLFTATPVGSDVSLFFRGSDSSIGNYLIATNCAVRQEIGLSPGMAKYLTAGTDQTGNAAYLFYTVGGNIRYARVIPYSPYVDDVAVPPSLSVYTNPFYLTAAQFARRFIPLMFTRAYPPPTLPPGISDTCTASYCLYYVNFPLPLDGEASVNNPWALKMGAPLIADVGGIVSPTTGSVALDQVLIAGKRSIGLIYRQPGLFYRTTSGYDDSYIGPQAHPIMPGIYYDLPWIAGTTLHMQGGQQFPLFLTGMSGNLRWFNSTRGIRYTLAYDTTSKQYTLTYPSGAYTLFDFISGSSNEWHVSKVYLDTTGNNYVTYNVDFGITGTIVDSSGRTITLGQTGPTAITYGNGQTIGLTVDYSQLCPGGTTSDSGTLSVTDAIGRVTKYTVCHFLLTKLESASGGRVDYTYATFSATPGPGNQIWQGSDVYSLPLLKMDIYNESAANVKARSLVFNWNFQNGEVVRAVVNTTDKGGVVQGSREYIFNSEAGTASVRTYDSGGQVLYYDMQTLNGANMKDLSGNANDGGIVGSSSSVPARYGNARQFDGTGNQYISAASSATTDITGSLTVSAWVSYTTIPNDNSASTIVRKFDIDGGNHGYILDVGDLTTTFPKQVRLYVGGTGSTGVVYSGSANTLASANTWYHVVGVLDAPAGKGYLYINGVLANSGPIPVYPASSGAVPLLVARSTLQPNHPLGPWNGVLDEVRIWNRALPPEDVGSLYTKNALKKGGQQNWYSINDMPHLAEGFVGDETSPSVVVQDSIDDWGNQIYIRGALGNETFASYANTNHQNQFFAPGRLAKRSGPIFNTEFFDFSDGLFPPGGSWTVATTFNPPPHADYSTFDKMAPSLVMGVPSSGTTNLTHILTATSPTFLEFRARQNVLGRFEVRLGTSSSYNVGVRFTTSGTIEAYDRSTNAWHACTLPGGGSATYTTYSWSRITVVFTWPYKTYLNGVDLSCGSPSNLGGQTQINFEAFGPGYVWSAWLDDIKIYHNDCNDPHCQSDAVLDVGFDGLQPRQSISLSGEDGSVIDQTMQSGTGTVWLSFNSALTGAYAYHENGDNARTTVRIYAEDGTLEYQSPLTRFFVGERYTYARPRAFADEVVKTRSGALYWPNSIYIDENCPGPTCSGTWTWVDPSTGATRSVMRGSKAHITTFDYGYREHSWENNQVWNAIPAYFVVYVKIPSNRASDTILFGVKTSTTGRCGYWGRSISGSSCFGGFPTNMGPIPTLRDQWIQLIVSSSDIGLTSTWDGMVFGAAGGEVEWDVATTLSSASLTITGLNTVCTGCAVNIYDSVNRVVIATGTESGGSATINMYKPSSVYSWTAFPVRANIQICATNAACSGNEYYFGPLRDLWPGDSLRYIGASSFFDPQSSTAAFWPGPTVHDTQIGSKRFSGDCLDAVLCYDMETMTEGATTSDTGAVQLLMLDLSGKGNSGAISGAGLSSISQSAAGLGATFDGTSNNVVTNTNVLSGVTAGVTISAWAYLQDASRKGAFVKVSSALNGYGLGVGSGTWDTAGNHLIGLYEGVRWIDTGASIGTGLHHVVMSISSTSVPSFYLDGNLVTGNFAGTNPLGPTAPTAIGGYNPDGSHPRFFAGTVDQVLIYTTVLTATQIIALYQSRMPGAPQIYSQPTSSPAGSGLISSSRVPYEGTYLYAVASYDSKGNVLSVTDLGRATAGGANKTNYEYSSLDGQDYLTKVTRPYVAGDTGSAGRPVYYAYDFQSGVKYGTLDIDCRRSRTSYDALGRPVQTSAFDTDPTEVLHLDMETASAGSLKDVSCAGGIDSRNGQVVTMGGTGTLDAPGAEGSARDFRGTGQSDFVSVSDSAGLNPTSFSISFWINPDAFPTSYVRILSKNTYNSPAGTYKGWTVLYNGVAPYGRIYLALWNTVNQEYDSQQVQLVSGRWQHVTFTFDGLDIKAYLNGVLQPCSGCTLTGTFAPSPSNLIVGAGDSNAINSYFDGKLDEVRFFNAVRSASEIVDLWQFRYKLLTRSSTAYDDMNAFPEFAGYPGASVTPYDGVSTPRSLFFDMETKKATINLVDYLEDLSGDGNHGKVTGASSVAGKLGVARQFSAAGDKVLVPAPNNLPLGSGSRTLSAWVNPTSTTAEQYVIAYGPATTSGDSFGLGIDSSGRLFVDIYNGRATSTLVVGTGAFHFVAATYNGGSQVTLYLDSATPQTVSFTGTATTPNTVKGNLIVGQWTSNTNYDTFKGIIDEVHLIPKALTGTEITAFYNGYTAGSVSFDGSHLSRAYTDGLGRAVRQVTTDMYGKKIQTVATLGWNDQRIYAYAPSGGYFTYTYDFLGRTLTVTTPGGTMAGISTTVLSDKARMAESVDAVGRKAYQKTDVLGRTIESAVWNPTTGSYGNLTKATYNALSKIVTSGDAKSQTTTVYYNSLGKPRMTVFPDGTYSLVDYDDNLRPFRTVDQMGRVATEGYDSLGRVVKSSLKASPSASTTYDTFYDYDPVHDDLLVVQNGTVNSNRATGEAKLTWTYDGLHRVKTERLEAPANSPAFNRTVSYDYDRADRILNITYPMSGSPKAVYAYDTLGRPAQVDYGGSKYAVLTYDPFGRLDNIHYWKDASDTLIEEKYAYDARDRITQVKVYKSGTTTKYMQLDYGYTKASEIASSTDDMFTGTGGASNPKSVTYLYDGNGRLAKAVGPYGSSEVSQTLQWTYDAVGNLLTSKVDATTYTYNDGLSYPVWNRLDSFSLNSTSFTYNAAGSMLTKVESGSTTTYTQDFQQRLVKIASGSNTYTYSYDGLGRRIANVTNAGPTSYFMYSGSKMLYSKVGSTDTAYVYVGDKLLLRKDGPLDARYYHHDASPGSVRLVTYYTTATGIQVDAKYRYKPFGHLLILSGSSQRFQFAQQEFDGFTLRQYHMGARYQDPAVGRFLQRDPIGPGYDYAANNPISFFDPTGEFAQIIAGAIVGGLIGYGLCVWQTGGWTSETCGKAALIGAAVGAFAVATFGLGMAAFGVGATGGIAAGSLAAVGAGIATGAAVGAQSYFLASILGIGLGTMTPQDLSMRDFAVSVGLGAAFGAVGGKYYKPETYWGWPRSRAPGVPRWPANTQEMDDLLGIKGRPVPGAPGGKMTWQFRNAAGEAREITGHSVPGAVSPAKQAWHWHYEPGHYTGYPGDEMPDWFVAVLRGAGIL
jgi:RHS repeat-associated protein